MIAATYARDFGAALCAVLALATPVAAQRTWWLWTSVQWGGSEEPKVGIYASYPSREACVAEIDATENLPRPSGSGVKEKRYRMAPTALHIIVDTGGIVMDTYWYCTLVAPRGPNGE
jgi:hypothetical protein